jgi:hypothetical protein
VAPALDNILSPATTPQASSNTASDPAASQSGAPDVYVTIPFGMTTVPTLATEPAKEAAFGAMMSPAAILNQDAVTQAGILCPE